MSHVSDRADIVTKDSWRRFAEQRWMLQVAAVAIFLVAAAWVLYRVQVRFFLPVALVTDWLLIWGGIALWQAADRFRFGIATDDELELQAGAAKVQQSGRALVRYAVLGLGLTVVMFAVAWWNNALGELHPARVFGLEVEGNTQTAVIEESSSPAEEGESSEAADVTNQAGTAQDAAEPTSEVDLILE
jgi:hypothetical protein